MDALVTQAHHLAHAIPVWHALAPEVRGRLFVGFDERMNTATARYGFDAHFGLPPDSETPVLVASGNELVAVKRAVLLSHGVDQSYVDVDHVCWAGGPGRENVVLFVCPNAQSAKKNHERYPNTPCAVVGSPHVEALRALPPYPLAEPRIAISTHWDVGNLIPELRSGWPWFEAAYEKMCRARPDAFVLHGHPRHADFVAWKAREWGVEYEPSFAALTQRAWCYVTDNSCVVPTTPVLCDDLVWREAGELVAGDRLIASDEERTRDLRRPRGSTEIVQREDRRLRTADVLSNERRWQPCLTVRTTHGDLTVSTTHPWLVRRKVEHRYMMDGRKPGQRWHTRSYHWRWEWANADQLKPGDEVAHLVEPWTQDDSRDAGWLAGMFDGEGCLDIGRESKRGSRRATLSIAQNEGPVLDEILRVLGDHKVNLYRQPVTGGKGYKCVKVTVGGSLPEKLSLLGSVRPLRLLAKMTAKQGWLGANVSAIVERATVLSVADVGVQEVCVLETSERTFVANGFLAHNSTLFEWAALGRPVVAVSPPWYRIGVSHGLRFWNCSDVGEHVTNPDDLEAALYMALADLAPQRQRRQTICAYLFGNDLSRGAAARAARAIEEVVG